MNAMDFLKNIWNEISNFFGWTDLGLIIQSGKYEDLLTWDGFKSLIGPLIPFLLLIEIFRAIFYRRFHINQIKVPMMIYIFNRVVSRFISIAAVIFCIHLFEKYALMHSSLKWYWFLYGYICWEFAHFIYHYLGHKVRIFWCLHSTHHAPDHMNLSVTYAHFFLEAPYADVIRTSICILAGVSAPMLFIIMFIDGTWGAFIHIGDQVLKNGRLGMVGRFILTPSHHRVHHAKNPLYMDTNFCNLLNIWDRVFRTYQPELKTLPPQYGITRNMNPHQFMDVYFGEFALLAKDLYHAPGWRNKVLYCLMPPGWSHTGEHKTAALARREALEKSEENIS